MDIQPIGNNKFIVTLSCNDLNELDITYDAMDYSNIETRRVIWTILDLVRQSTGRDIDPSGNLLIEAAPSASGGCILMFTVPVSASNIGTVISKNNLTGIFEFETADDLLDCLSLTGLKGADERIFTDGKKFRAELPNEKIAIFKHTLEEYGKFIGKDRLTAAATYEHWSEITKSTS